MEPETPEPLPDQNPETVPKKRIKDLPLEQRREYQRLAKQRSREKQRLEGAANEIRLADDYIVPKAWDHELTKFSDETVQQVQAEIGQVTDQDKYVVSGLAEISLGLEKGYVQRVEFPAGILVGMWFPEALGAEAIRHLSTNPALSNSPTFMDVYHRALVRIAKWADTAPVECVNRESISRIREELR